MTGDIANGRAHFDRGIALCDSMDMSASQCQRSETTKVVMLGFRAIALWLLGYPKASLADAEHALSRAREITPVGTLMHTLSWIILIRILCGDHVTASRLVDELVALADEKDTSFWKAWGMMNQRLASGLNRQGLGCGPGDYLRDRSVAVNWSNNVLCRFTHHVWREVMRSLANLRMRGASFAKL